MDRETFKLCIPSGIAGKVTASTVDLWHAIFEYVVEHGQTDCHDHRLFRHLQKATGRNASDRLISSHLHRLSEAGIFDTHRIRVTPGPFYMPGFLSNDSPPPGKFHCYTLPGKTVNLEVAGKRNFIPPRPE